MPKTAPRPDRSARLDAMLMFPGDGGVPGFVREGIRECMVGVDCDLTLDPAALAALVVSTPNLTSLNISRLATTHYNDELIVAASIATRLRALNIGTVAGWGHAGKEPNLGCLEATTGLECLVVSDSSLIPGLPLHALACLRRLRIGRVENTGYAAILKRLVDAPCADTLEALDLPPLYQLGDQGWWQCLADLPALRELVCDAKFAVKSESEADFGTACASIQVLHLSTEPTANWSDLIGPMTALTALCLDLPVASLSELMQGVRSAGGNLVHLGLDAHLSASRQVATILDNSPRLETLVVQRFSGDALDAVSEAVTRGDVPIARVSSFRPIPDESVAALTSLGICLDPVHVGISWRGAVPGLIFGNDNW